jgi:cyclopropane-fatty-acyl-phospholipid synthase
MDFDGFVDAGFSRLMENITEGQLRVLTYSHIYTFPAPLIDSEHPERGSKAELRVANDVFWVRLCAMSDLGFAEAYMYGDVECDDLVSLFHVCSIGSCSNWAMIDFSIFQIFLENRENLSNLNSKLSFLFTLPQKITSYRFLNTIGNSRSNISAHYDISNAMFSGMLRLFWHIHPH